MSPVMTRSRALLSKRKESYFMEDNSSVITRPDSNTISGSGFPVVRGEPLSASKPSSKKELDHKFCGVLQYFKFSVSVLVALILAGGYYVYSSPPELGVYLAGASFGLLGFCLFISISFMPNGPFIRPHLLFWRIILGLGLFYAIFLMVLLFLPLDLARQLFHVVVDGSLGIPLPSRSYAENCTITSFYTILDQIDIFVYLHFFGWVVKALIFRDLAFCWIISILFEFLEYGLEHQLPNFAECWWDHWILDVLLCNYVGIVIGSILGKYFAIKPFSLVYSGGIVKPISLIFNSVKSYFQVLFLIMVVLIAEITPFYMKHLLWIPTAHPFNACRLLLVTFLSFGAVREYYDVISESEGKIVRPFFPLALLVFLFELLICTKWGYHVFKNPMPYWTKVGFSFAAFLTLLFMPILIYITKSKVKAN